MVKYIITLALLSFSLLAQPLTLQESINKALRNYPNIKRFELEIMQSKSALDSVKSDYLPQVTAQGNYNALQTYVFPANGQFNTLDDDGWSGGVSFKQKIWDFSKTTRNIDAFKIEEDIARLSLQEQKALLVYKIKSLYALMVVQKEAIAVREKDVESKEAYYNQALAFVKQGLKTGADASRFLSALYIAKESLAQSQSSYEKAKNSLSLYMGEDIDERVELENGLLDLNVTLPSIDEILAQNYQLKISTKTIAKTINLHKSAQAQHYGSIDAIGSYTHINTLNEYDAKALGVSVNIPLYSGGKISAEAQKASIGVQIAKEQKRAALLSVKEEIVNTYADVKAYRITLAAKKAQMHSSKETTKLLQGRYKEGLATYIEVLDAIALELNAKLGLLSAKYQLATAIYKLQYLQGKIV